MLASVCRLKIKSKCEDDFSVWCANKLAVAWCLWKWEKVSESAWIFLPHYLSQLSEIRRFYEISHHMRLIIFHLFLWMLIKSCKWARKAQLKQAIVFSFIFCFNNPQQPPLEKYFCHMIKVVWLMTGNRTKAMDNFYVSLFICALFCVNPIKLVAVREHRFKL